MKLLTKKQRGKIYLEVAEKLDLYLISDYKEGIIPFLPPLENAMFSYAEYVVELLPEFPEIIQLGAYPTREEKITCMLLCFEMTQP